MKKVFISIFLICLILFGSSHFLFAAVLSPKHKKNNWNELDCIVDVETAIKYNAFAAKLFLIEEYEEALEYYEKFLKCAPPELSKDKEKVKKVFIPVLKILIKKQKNTEK